MRTINVTLSLLFLTLASMGQMALTSRDMDRRLQEAGMADAMKLGNSHQVVSIDVDAQIDGQVAEVSVSQILKNPGDRDLEVEILFPLPDDGLVQNFVMMVDGKEITGRLMKKEEATRIYNDIVRRKRDPALMEYAGYGLFKTSVFPMAVGEEREITLRYTQILSKKSGMLEFDYPFGTQKFSSSSLRKYSMDVTVKSDEAIKNILCPSHDVDVKRIGPREMRISMQRTYSLPKSDFRLNWSVSQRDVALDMVSFMPAGEKEGYFLLMASPGWVAETGRPKANKRVVFVLDRSGSMSGKKMEQSREAMKFVLDNLNQGDLFNIVCYDDVVERYKPEMMRVDEHTVEDAKQYVDRIRPGGGTDIGQGVTNALSLLSDKSMPSYVIFLTDGLPTSGNTDEQVIAREVLGSNSHGARIFCFGVGNDVNARLLDRMSSRNGGLTEYVLPSEEIEAKVSNLFNNITEPVVTDISVHGVGCDLRQIYPNPIPDLFTGGQIVISGTYFRSGDHKVVLKGNVGGETRELEYDIHLNSVGRESQGNDYVQKLWVNKRIGFIINKLDLDGHNQELVDELVSLSTQHGILTPYTAFLAREDVDIADADGLIRQANRELERLDMVQGAEANGQRDYKNKVLNGSFSFEESEKMAESISEDFAEGAPKDVQVMKNIGQKTFYYRDNRWVESGISPQELSKAENIVQFSDDYFKLSAGQEVEFNKYLSLDGDIVVRWNGNVYNVQSP